MAQDDENDEQVAAEAQIARGLAFAHGQAATWRPTAEQKIALDRLELRRVDRAAAAARSVLALPSAPAAVPVMPSQADDDVTRIARVAAEVRSAAVARPGPTSGDDASRIARVAAEVRKTLSPGRMSAEEAPLSVSPQYDCAKCANRIAPEDAIYCSKCAGFEDQPTRGKPADARACSECGEPVGAKVYCATCAGQGSTEKDKSPSSARVYATRHTPLEVNCPGCGAASGKPCSRQHLHASVTHCNGRVELAETRSAVSLMACASGHAAAGSPCRDNAGRLVGRYGACRSRTQAYRRGTQPPSTKPSEEAFYARRGLTSAEARALDSDRELRSALSELRARRAG